MSLDAECLLDQLEAVTEFYFNRDEPWSTAVHGERNGRSYRPVNFCNPSGYRATVEGGTVFLDGKPDLTRVTPCPPSAICAGRKINYDTIYLRNDRARASGLYRITEVDHANHRLTIDRDNPLTGKLDDVDVGSAGTSWCIHLRPILVLVDPLGPRQQNESALAGDCAQLNSAAKGHAVLTLDGAPDLRKVNAGMDTIYLAEDVAESWPGRFRTYRILHAEGNRVTVDGIPLLDGGQSRWHIPAGIGGDFPGLDYDLGPGGAKGYDHFDGALFLVYGGTIRAVFRWSSYTSRGTFFAHKLSSIRGNRRYMFRSFTSSRSTGPKEFSHYVARDGIEKPKPFRNYSLKIEEFAGSASDETCPGGWNGGLIGSYTDKIHEARFYFADPVVADPKGMSLIRMHHSVSHKESGFSSSGCLVSPEFTALRTALVQIYQAEHLAFFGTSDAEVAKLNGLCHDDSMALYEGLIAGGLSREAWDEKLAGTLWIVRPDELPLGPTDALSSQSASREN